MTDEGATRKAAEELALAREEVTVAEQLIQAGHPRIALTRVYFAVFHAMRAALAAGGFEPKTHRGTLTMFGMHFVKTGTYEPAVSRLLSRLQRFREEADYGTSFVIDVAGAREELEAARAFVERVAVTVTGADA